MAVVAVARKLSELVWHLLVKDQDFLYEKPHLTIDKRFTVRKLSRRRTGRSAPSASARLGARPALYGSGLQGKKVKTQIAKLASEQSEAIYQAIIEHRQNGSDSTNLIETAGFDPGALKSPSTSAEPVVYTPFTSRLLAGTRSLFCNVNSSTPLLNAAVARPGSTSTGRSIVRQKRRERCSL